MNRDSPRASRDDARSYLLALLAGLVEETRVEVRDPEAAAIIERAEKLARDLESADLRRFGPWQKAVHSYESVADAVAAARNSRARTARSYESMEEMARDAEAQAKGKSPHAIWDAEEHGLRRQIERRIADRFSAEDALLVNSGASAIAVAVGALRLGRGATVLTGRHAHPETTSFLTRYVAPSGVKIVRAPLGHGDTVIDALRALRPELALFETATAAPGSEVPSRVEEWFAASPSTTFVVDNTVQSLLTPWFARAPGPRRRLVVVESAAKYLSHRCMAGVVYGPEALMGPIRDYARATGQHLQEKAFNYIRPAEIEQLRWKLTRHATNARVFAAEAAGCLDIDVRLLDSEADPEARASLFANGPGCLVFVRLGARRDPAGGHRRLLAAFQAQARKRGAWVPVRAGFGWMDTTARIQEPTGERVDEGPRYLRVSVGIEPEHIVRDLGKALRAASDEVCLSLGGAPGALGVDAAGR